MKQTIRLTESDIRRMVMEAMNELDWKTYASAADKTLRGSSRKLRKKPMGDINNRAHKFARAAEDAFNRDYGYEEFKPSSWYEMDSYLPPRYSYDDDGYEYDHFHDWLKNTKGIDPSSLTSDEYDNWYNTFLQGGDDLDGNTEASMSVNNTQRGWDGDLYGDSFKDRYEFSPYKYTEYSNQENWPEGAYPSDELILAKNRGNKEIRDFKNGRYDYEKGKGWINRNDKLNEAVTRAIRKYLK